MQRYAQFYFFIKGSRLAVLSNIVNDWPNFIAWLSLLLEILRNMYILIICFPACDLINFYLIAFLSSRFSKLVKSQHKNVNISRTKRAFSMKKGIFHHFYRSVKNKNNFFGR